MTRSVSPHSPAFLLSLATFACLLAVGLTIVAAIATPWMGISLHDAEDKIIVTAVSPRGPMATSGINEGAQLLAIDTPTGERIDLRPDDAIEEPDMIETYDGLADMLQRQTRILAMLRTPGAALITADSLGHTSIHAIAFQKHRPLISLPVSFWIQILVGTGGFMISLWVWALRPHEWATRFFALTGTSLLISSFAAAIYSSRELAIDGTFFRILSHLNHLGALGFGVFMIALFSVYPRQLFSLRSIFVMGIVISIWLVLGCLWVLPMPYMAAQLATVSEMAAIIALIVTQRIVCRHDPRALAALRWLGLSVTIGAGAFIVTIQLPQILQHPVPIDQAYAFLFFLLIHCGVALGVSRYKLFELGVWSFRILFYMTAAFALLAVDALLIYGLHMAPMQAFGLALIIITFGYLPLRDVLWRRFVAGNRADGNMILHDMIDVAFGRNDAVQARLWQSALEKRFAPLETLASPEPVTQAAIIEDGLTLAIPAMAGSPALLLRCPRGGRGLFSPDDLHLAKTLLTLMEHAEKSRISYERGASEERRRIAQDLHDDVGAHLISSLHKTQLNDTQDAVRQAIADMRTIMSGLNGKKATLQQTLADMRYETGRRLDGAKIALSWDEKLKDADVTLLDYAVYKNLISAHREIVTNIIRHSGAKNVTVAVTGDEKTISITTSDDGCGMPETTASGHGVANISRRISGIGGDVVFIPVAKGISIRIILPLR